MKVALREQKYVPPRRRESFLEPDERLELLRLAKLSRMIDEAERHQWALKNRQRRERRQGRQAKLVKRIDRSIRDIAAIRTPVVVGDVTFPSISAAARALGYDLPAFRRHVNRGRFTFLVSVPIKKLPRTKERAS
jgi:hypothetical protein